MTGEVVTRMYRIYQTVFQMLRDREYLVMDSEIKMSKEQFVNKFGSGFQKEDLIINKSKKREPTDQVHSIDLNSFVL